MVTKEVPVPRTLAIAALAALTTITVLVSGHAAAAHRQQPAATARAGDLDRAFGTGGKVVTDFGGFEAVEDLAIQRDGKVLAVGTRYSPDWSDADLVLARYRRDGSPDPSFGSGGKVVTTLGGESDSANALVLQPDGKIVVAGFTYSAATGSDFGLARFRADGSFDDSFGNGGKVRTDFEGKLDGVWALAIQPNGRLVAAGTTREPGPYETHLPHFALARYMPGGSLDTSFGAAGKVETTFVPGFSELAYDVAIGPGGRVVAAGWAAPDGTSGPGTIDIASYSADGSLDRSFDGDGKLVSAPTSDNGAYGALVQPDGKLVLAGISFGIEGHPTLFRYTRGGKLDFLATAPVGGGASDVARQPDGKLVTAGTAFLPSGSEVGLAVARFEKNGMPDPSFQGGAVVTDFGPWDMGNAVALGADGKIVVGGSTGEYSEAGITRQDFALARYLGSPPCKVPDVRGRRLAAVRAALSAASCRLGTVTRRSSSRVARGRVLSQSPKPGAKLPSLGRVSVVVSRG